IVGDDQAGWIDDEAGAERIDLARLEAAAVVAAAIATAAPAILEEVIEELLERRTGRQVRHRAAAAGVDGLRGRDVDDGVDHLLGDISDVFRPASRCRACQQGARGDARGESERACASQDFDRAEHGGSVSWRIKCVYR